MKESQEQCEKATSQVDSQKSMNSVSSQQLHGLEVHFSWRSNIGSNVSQVMGVWRPKKQCALFRTDPQDPQDLELVSSLALRIRVQCFSNFEVAANQGSPLQLQLIPVNTNSFHFKPPTQYGYIYLHTSSSSSSLVIITCYRSSKTNHRSLQ